METEKVIIAIESNEVSKQTDPYSCAIQIKSGESIVTVGHKTRQISRHCNFFSKEGGGEINDMFSTTYRPSSILSGDFEIPLVLQFQSPKYVTHCSMKKSIQILYDYRGTGTKPDSSDEEPEGEIFFFR